MYQHRKYLRLKVAYWAVLLRLHRIERKLIRSKVCDKMRCGDGVHRIPNKQKRQVVYASGVEAQVVHREWHPFPLRVALTTGCNTP